MNRFAVINADDFGFSKGVNQAIIKAHESGILTSTSLMVTGNYFEEAVALAKTHPDLGVGLHLVLVCGKSVLPPAKIPHLVDESGNFLNNSVAAGLRYQFNAAAKQELTLEICAQLEKFHQTGLNLSHVDGHLHLHVHPVILQILVELAEEFQIPFIRLPYEELSYTLKCDRTNLLTKLIWSQVFGQLRRYGEKLLDRQAIQYTQRVYGLLQTGNLTESYLLQLIPQIQANFIEIYAHPALSLLGEPQNGPAGAGERELTALLSEAVREVLQENGFILSNYATIQKILSSSSCNNSSFN